MNQVSAKLNAGWRSWERFWFAPADPLVLCIMRWFVGGMLLYTNYVWGTQLEAFYGEQSWLSKEMLGRLYGNDYYWSLWYVVPENSIFLFHWCCFAVLVAYVIGFATPVTAVLAFLISMAYSTRAYHANYGLDQINAVLSLYLAIAPCGRYLSVDALLWRRGEGENSEVSRFDAIRANFALRLMQSHYCVIYLFAGLSKAQGETWWDGQAIWMAAANYEYQSWSLTWLVNYPWLCDLMSVGTVLWEVSFAFLIWNRTLRPLVLLAGISMHLGIALFMGMPTFGLMMIYGYWCLVPPELPRRVIRALLNDDSKRDRDRFNDELS